MKWTEHPILRPPSKEQIERLTINPDGSDNEEGLRKLHELWEAHESAIKSSHTDPLKYGFEPECWGESDKLFDEFDTVISFGGNRSSKSTYGARTVVKAALENPGSMILCFAQDHDASIRIQQRYVYEYLPPDLKEGVRDKTAYSKYTLKNGFTGGGLILPNGSQIAFHAYSQFTANRAKFEGLELGSKTQNWHNVALWLDEYLEDGDLVDTMRFRLATRDAKMLITFTPIDGYTSFVADILKGAETIQSRPAELLDNEVVPYVQKSTRKNAGIIYFHSEFNKFGGYERLKKEIQHSPREEILVRLYGIPVKSITTLFPLFSREINVIEHDKLPEFPKKQFSRFHIIDPAGKKNWFMCWIAVNESGTWYVYREWPDFDDWAEIRKNKWVPGPGSVGIGYGIHDYANLIRDLEDGEPIFERLIDPRMGAATYQNQFGASSIIEDLSDNDIVCNPAIGIDIEDGIQALQNKMSYDARIPVDGANHPNFYVSDRCQNIIKALSEYTGKDGKDEAWKDPIDVLRYAAVSSIRHIPESGFKAKTVGKGGY